MDYHRGNEVKGQPIGRGMIPYPKEVLEVGGGSGLRVLFEPQPEMLPYSPS